MNVIKRSSLIAITGFLVLSVFSSNAVQAETNPFAAKDLVTIVAHEHKDKCGEGKCGEAKKKAHAKKGKCGEGKCGEGKMKAHAKKGKCGEGKCGEAKMKAHAKKGKCGEGK